MQEVIFKRVGGDGGDSGTPFDFSGLGEVRLDGAAFSTAAEALARIHGDFGFELDNFDVVGGQVFIKEI